MQKFQCFLWPNAAWNLCISLKLMVAILVLSQISVFSLCVTCFLTNTRKDEWHTQQLIYNVDLKVHLNVALTLFLIH